MLFCHFFLERFLSLANHGEAPRTDNADAGEKSRFAKITPKKKKKQHKNNENTHRHDTKASLFFYSRNSHLYYIGNKSTISLS